MQITLAPPPPTAQAEVSDTILRFYGDRESSGPDFADPAWAAYDRETTRLYTERYAARARTAIKELAPYVSAELLAEDQQRLREVEAEMTGPAVNSLMVQDIGESIRYLPSACTATCGEPGRCLGAPVTRVKT